MKNFLKESIIALLLVAVIVSGFRFTLEQYFIEQVSMLPRLVEGERVLLEKVTYRIQSPARGDIVVFHPPPKYGETPLIKRIIALPGETVFIKDGRVHIEGTALEESYCNEPPRYEMEPFNVPDDGYFVLGDNRNVSYDSHYGWTVPFEDIIGRVWLTVWPPSEWGVIPDHAYLSD
ncbi:signal peptidase I [Chloroflexota bacterium]